MRLLIIAVITCLLTFNANANLSCSLSKTALGTITANINQNIDGSVKYTEISLPFSDTTTYVAIMMSSLAPENVNCQQLIVKLGKKEATTTNTEAYINWCHQLPFTIRNMHLGLDLSCGILEN